MTISPSAFSLYEDTSEAELRQQVDVTLRLYLALSGEGAAYAAVPNILLRELVLPSLTSEIVMPVIARFLTALYAEDLDSERFKRLFRQGYDINREVNWEAMLVEIATYGVNYSSYDQRYAFYGEQHAAGQVLAATYLASGLTNALVAVGLLLAHAEQYLWAMENGAVEWGMRMMGLLKWFEQAGTEVLGIGGKS